MLYATVTRCLVAPVKDDRLTGLRLVLAETEDGSTVAAADTLGAGVGARVLIVTGAAARLMVNRPEAPLDAAVAAIVDD